MKNWKNIINNPKFKHGTMATIVTISIIAIIILVYAISIILNDKIDMSLDMTSNKIFDLSQESKDYIKNLDHNITIRVLVPEKEFENHPYYPEQYNQLNHILRLYDKYSDHISLVYDDMIKNPRIVDKYNGEDVGHYSVVIESDNKRHKILNIDNLFEISQNYMSADLKASKAEQAIITSIIGITSEEQLNIGFLTGHQENNVSDFKKLLTDNLYNVTEVNLLTGEIPQELSMIVIAAPKKDFTVEEIEQIKRYLDNDGKYGKNVLYFASITKEKLPNLKNFLNSWDINAEEAIVIDEEHMTQLSQYSAFVEYSDKEMFGSLLNNNAYTVFIESRPINFINSETEGVEHNELLNFSDSAVGLKYSEESVEEIDQASIKGPFGAIVKTTKGSDNNKSSVIVSGSLISVDGTLLYRVPVSNGDVYLKIVNEVTDKKDIGINIVSKEFRGDEINIKQKTVNVFRLIFVVLVPAMVIGTGLSVWISRRNR